MNEYFLCRRVNPMEKSKEDREKELSLAFRMTSSDKNLWKAKKDGLNCEVLRTQSYLEELDVSTDIVLPEVIAHAVVLSVVGS